MYILRNVAKLKPANTKSFFGALNIIFNRVNGKRIKEVGPDRACAEWLMRNGAHIRWKGHPAPLGHYNQLPLDPEQSGEYYIEEVIAHEASISHHGFDHFCNCSHITTMSFDQCAYFDERCIKKLGVLANSLLCLEIKRCPSVCAESLLCISNLKNLQILKLHKLEIENLESYICKLKEHLPNCQINPV